MYHILRRLLFCLDAEVAHDLTLGLLPCAERLGLLSRLLPRVEGRPVEVMGLRFPNAVGLAAGMDKNGQCVNALGQLGFGFIEIGTVTPRPQSGNPKPRIFRLPQQRAIINRMGFNNRGLDYLIRQVGSRRFDGILGINIGKNRDTPVERAAEDYVKCLEAVYPHADYIAVNISSPNTPGLRDLQFGDSLRSLLTTLKDSQRSLREKHQYYVPVAVKIAPDMDDVAISQIAELLLETEMDAVIATNTTISREGVESSSRAHETGGLSGAPLLEKSTSTIRTLSSVLQGQLPIIGVGGILSGDDAERVMEAGASLVQLYSGFIYGGPGLIGECVEALNQRL